jgi:hypothetical protein
MAKARSRKTVKCRTASKDVRRPSASADLEAKVARLRRERDEALERETATSEVLKVISASAGELEPVFAAMLDNATRARHNFRCVLRSSPYTTLRVRA